MAYSDLVKPKDNWRERVEKLCDARWFSVHIGTSMFVEGNLSEEERLRLDDKLALVKKAASLMAAGMLKGVLKYDTDDYPVETWLAHVLDEGADQMNYQMLLADAYERAAAKEDMPF